MGANFSRFIDLENFHAPSKSDFSFDSYLANQFVLSHRSVLGAESVVALAATTAIAGSKNPVVGGH
jgi:hypothetical protein